MYVELAGGALDVGVAVELVLVAAAAVVLVQAVAGGLVRIRQVGDGEAGAVDVINVLVSPTVAFAEAGK